MDLKERLTIVKGNWSKLAQKDKKLEIPGAYSHAYKIFPALTEEQLNAEEQKFHIHYPEEYRKYMLEIFEGGVGPWNGLYSLTNALVPLDGEDSKYVHEHPDHYSKLFPFNNNDVIEFLQKDSSGQRQPPFLMNQDQGGYLFLSEYGGGGFYIMPLNGEQAGTVWFLQETDGPYNLFPHYVVKDNSARQFDFLDWIEDWQNFYLEPGNFISDPNEPFENPDNVKKIMMSLKNIPTIPEHIFLCKNLTTLSMRSCKLKVVSEKINDFKNLEKLDLYLNDISELPDTICELQNLKELNLAGNKLTSLPEKIGNLSNVTFLNICDNKITDFPESFYQLKNLKRLLIRELSSDLKQKIKDKLPQVDIIFPTSMMGL